MASKIRSKRSSIAKQNSDFKLDLDLPRAQVGNPKSEDAAVANRQLTWRVRVGFLTK
jgi:hypothetical protein